MNDPLSIQRNNEMDARNRAAAYTAQAQQEAEQKQHAIVDRNATDFQQMLWLKNLDQTSARELQAQAQAHEMALRSAEHRAAIELEAQKRQTAIELRRLEIESARGMKGIATAPNKVAEKSIWQSDLMKTIIAISIPIILPAILEAILKTTVPSPRIRYQSVGQRRKLYRASLKRRRKSVGQYQKRRRASSWQRNDLKL